MVFFPCLNKGYDDDDDDDDDDEFIVFRNIYWIDKLQEFKQNSFFIVMAIFRFIVLENVLDLLITVSTEIFSCYGCRHSFIWIKRIVVHTTLYQSISFSTIWPCCVFHSHSFTHPCRFTHFVRPVDLCFILTGQ